MSNKFLTSGSAGLDDGTADIYINSIRVNDITKSKNVKTDSVGILIGADIGINDVTNLQANLDTKLDDTVAKFQIQSTPSIPPVGELKIYAKSDNLLYQLDSNGLENPLQTGSVHPYDQFLNTTDAVTFAGLTLNQQNITLGENLTPANFSTQVGGRATTAISRGTGCTIIGVDSARDVGINNTVIGSEVLSSGVASGDNSVCIGRGCAQIGDLAGNNTVIGFNSAFQGSNANSVCIGNLAGNTSRVDSDCILINADNFPLESTGNNEIKLKAGNTDLIVDALDIKYNGSSIKNDDLNSKTQNISLADTSAGLTKFVGRVNSDFAFSDNSFDNVIYGTDITGFTPTLNGITVFGSQCGVSLGQDNTNIGFSAGSINTGEKNTNLGSLAGGESATIPQGSNSVCVGYLSGGGNPDGSVCIGSEAGNRCGVNSISVGRQAGAATQSAGAIAIGGQSAQANQGTGSISIGENACNVGQGIGSVAIGQNACSTSAQGASSVAIGNLSALTNQGANAVAIGALSAQTNQHAKTIVLNGDTSGLNTTQENEIRMKAGLSTLDINQTSGLVVNGQNFTTKVSDLESKTQNINLATTIAGETHIDNKLFVDGELITEDTEIHLGAGVYANNQSATEVVLIGRQAAEAGSANATVVIGTRACRVGGAGTLSTVIGRFASELAQSGQGSVIVGNAAARQTAAGTCSIVVGCEANDGAALTNGQKYICIGNQSGRNGVGNGAICIGDRAGLGLAVPANSILLAAKINTGATVSASNEMKFVAGNSEFQYDGTDINFTNATQPTNKGNLNISTINNLTPVGGFFSQISNIAVNSLANPPTEQVMIADVGVGARVVPANAFIVGGTYRVSQGGFLTCVNNAQLTIRIYGGAAGTTLLGSLPTLTIPTSTNQWFGIESYFVVRALGVGGVGVISARAVYSANADNQNQIYGQSFHTINSSLFDSTTANKLQLTAQWGSQNDGTITTTQATFHRIF